MAECEKVCRYIDLPLQHASADVLKRMRRPGNRRTYDKLLLARIRDRVPDVTLRTTLIVGFPGETEPEFAELDGFVADTGFDHVGVFTYSHEEGTRAFGAGRRRAGGGEAAATERPDGAAEEDSRARRSKARIGTDVAVLIDGPSAEHEMVLQGRLEGQAPDIDSVVYLTDCDPTDYRHGRPHPGPDRRGRGYDLVAAPIQSWVNEADSGLELRAASA